MNPLIFSDSNIAVQPLSNSGIIGEDTKKSPNGYLGSEGMTLPPYATIIDNTDTPMGFIKKGATIFSSVLNLTKAVLGTGILALPYALGESGWAVGIVLMVFAFIGALFTLHIVSKCRNRIGPDKRASYGGIFEAAFPGYGWIADLIVVLMCIGSMISYMIVLGDLMPQFINEVHRNPPAFIVNRQFWIALVSITVSLPLSMMRDLSPLRYTSIMALMATLYLVLLSILFFSEPLPIFYACGEGVRTGCQGTISPIQRPHDNLAVMRSFPLFIFSFTSHPLVPELYNDLKRPNVRRMDIVTVTSMSIALVFYAVFSFCGYFTYGAGVSSNILLGYPVVMPVSIARILMCFIVAVSYPLLLHPTREACQGIIIGIMNRLNKEELVTPGTRGAKILYFSVTAFLYAASVGPALGVSDLGIVFNVVGATACTAAAFILPPLTYLRMFVYNNPKEDSARGWVPVHEHNYRFSPTRRWACYFYITFGVCFIPIALAGIFS